MKEKITEFIKSHAVLVICIVAVAVTAVIAICVTSLGSEESQSMSGWGEGITEGIPQFDGVADDFTSEKQSYAAAYYSNVTGEQVSAYTEKIEIECGVEFGSDKYPRSAVYGDRIIVIHYNVTEMKLSVTVASTNSIESTQSGEQQ